MALLEVRDLVTELAVRGRRVRVVDGVSFSVDSGETLGLVGESGCGKSITALSVLGLLPPGSRAAGTVRFDGRDLLAMSETELRRLRSNEIAMVFQDPMTSLDPIMPVGRQLVETLEHKGGLHRSAARRKAVDLLEMVGVPNPDKRAGQYPHQFSGGMRQRVMIALALSCEPRLILADEPTTALDVTTQAQILDLLRELTSGSRTALMLITHDLGVVAGMTQRVHVMYAGRIVEKARTVDLFAHPRMPYTWGLLRSVPRLGSGADTALVSIEGQPPDLAQSFQGCRFAPRCAHRRTVCETAPYRLLDVGDEPGHQTSCLGCAPEHGWIGEIDWRETSGRPVAREVGAP